MNFEHVSGKQCESYLLLPVFDTLLSAPLISSNNSISRVRAAAIVSVGMIYEASNVNEEAIVGVAGDVMHLIRCYSFFNPRSLSSYPSSSSSPTSFFNLSSPISSASLSPSHACHTLYLCIVLLLHHCPFLLHLLSFSLNFFLDNPRAFFCLSFMLLTSFHDFIPLAPLLLSPSIFPQD